MFCKYIRSKQRNAVTVKSVTDAAGILSQSDVEAADILCKQFQQVFADHGFVDLMKSVPLCRSLNEELFADDLFTEDVVYKKLCLLNASKSPGPDAVHPHFLKNCADLIAFPLVCIFRKSFEDGCMPDDWKSANVVPLYKKGSKLDPGNYRPVSLTLLPFCLVVVPVFFSQLFKYLFSPRSPHLCYNSLVSKFLCSITFKTY